jgi:hypothetical protein
MSSNRDNESAERSKMERKQGGGMASSSSVDKEKEHAESAGSGNDIENNAQMNEIAIAASEVGTAGRVPFTSLSQVDADLALARALQEQVAFAPLEIIHLMR